MSVIKKPTILKKKGAAKASERPKKKVHFSDDVVTSPNKFAKITKLVLTGKKDKKSKKLKKEAAYQKKLKIKTVGERLEKAFKSEEKKEMPAKLSKQKKRKLNISEDVDASVSPKKKKLEENSDQNLESQNGKQETATKTNWKDFKRQKKELRIKRRMKGEGKEVYEMSVKAKKIWEELRSEKCKGSQRDSLAYELYNLIKGKVKQVIYAHDTCRVVECLMSVSLAVIKQGLFEELKDDIVRLSRDKYAHFFVLKVLRYGTREQRKYVMKQLQGSIVALMKHKIAGDVVECAYNDWANAEERARITQEFYGPEFRLFPDEIYPNLASAFQKYPEKKEKILGHVKIEIHKTLDKGNFRQSIMHYLLSDYINHCDAKDRADLIESMREHLISILHTRDGAKVAMKCLWYGTHKDRKVIVKSMKTHVKKIACDEFGYLVLLALFDCVDDTVLVSNAILGEMLMDVMSLLENDRGRKVILYLVSPRNTTYLHPDILNILKEGDSNTMSKKDPAIRRAELKNSVMEPLMVAANEYLEDFIKNNASTVVLAALFLNGNASDELTQLVYGKLVGMVLRKTDSLTESAAGHMLIKKIIHHDKQRKEESSEVTFSEMLMNSASTQQIKTLLNTNRGAFTLLIILESDVKEISNLCRKKLMPLKQHIENQDHKGAQLLLNKL